MPSVSRAVRAWPSRWLTASSGLPVTSDSALAVVSPIEHAADQPGPGRRGDAVEIGEAQGRPVHGAPDQPVDHLHMRPRGDLGNDAAIGGVLGDLAEHLVGEDLAAPVSAERDDGGRRLVAGGLEAEDAHGTTDERKGRRGASRAQGRHPIVRAARGATASSWQHAQLLESITLSAF